MLWLFMLGPIVQSMVSKKQFVILYIISGVTGGGTFLVMQAIVPEMADATLVGALAGILGTMAAAVCIAPRLAIRFWFPPISIQLWILFVAIIILALFNNSHRRLEQRRRSRTPRRRIGGICPV